MRWRTRGASDFGTVLMGQRIIAHVVPTQLDDLATQADTFRPRFADARMERELAPCLPRRIATLRTADGMVFVERKQPGEILLRDLLQLRPIDPRHAAWITTRLVNLACWLQWAGIAHGAIGPDTLLVSPRQHTVALTGPFLCASSFGTRPPALPARTLDLAPRYGIAGATSDEQLDPELVRQTVRELLGDPAGTRLAADPAFPKPFAAWLLMPAADGARSDFPGWEDARDASFGARRFIPWNIDVAALRTA